MSKVEKSFKRFLLAQFIVVVLTFLSVFLFDQITAGQMGVTSIFRQVGKIIIVILFGSVAIIFIRRLKPLLSKYVGSHPATVFQYLMIIAACIVMIFVILQILQVSPSSLIIGGGVVSLVFGLIVSQTVGGFLAGSFVLVTHPYDVGDTILINNIPCKVEKITSLTTRARNDFGGLISIPNTAIMQGNVIITSFDEYKADPVSRLPYVKGDRIYTTYLNQEGVVTEITPFHTKIMLDSGKELTFLNASILTGTVAVARISNLKKK